MMQSSVIKPHGKPTGPRNVHATAIAIAGIGILIEGRSGAGKTSLAFGLIDAARRRDLAAEFIADDQVLLTRTGGALVAEPPVQIAGMAEVFGYGIVPVTAGAKASISLLVQLRDDATIERMPEPQSETIFGVRLPRLAVPARHEAQAVRIVMAHLASKLGFSL